MRSGRGVKGASEAGSQGQNCEIGGGLWQCPKGSAESTCRMEGTPRATTFVLVDESALEAVRTSTTRFVGRSRIRGVRGAVFAGLARGRKRRGEVAPSWVWSGPRGRACEERRSWESAVKRDPNRGWRAVRLRWRRAAGSVIRPCGPVGRARARRSSVDASAGVRGSSRLHSSGRSILRAHAAVRRRREQLAASRRTPFDERAFDRVG